MRFYNQQHRHTCGVDLHALSMYLCILDQAGEVHLRKNLKASSQALLKAVAPSATTSWSPLSACSPGTGWPISSPTARLTAQARRL